MAVGMLEEQRELRASKELGGGQRGAPAELGAEEGPGLGACHNLGLPTPSYRDFPEGKEPTGPALVGPAEGRAGSPAHCCAKPVGCWAWFVTSRFQDWLPAEGWTLLLLCVSLSDVFPPSLPVGRPHTTARTRLGAHAPGCQLQCHPQAARRGGAAPPFQQLPGDA